MTDEVFDGLETHKNGTITAHIEGTRYQLRRPKAGEYRKLREQLELIQDSIFEKTVDAKVTRDALNAIDEDSEGPDTKEKIEKRIELQIQARQLDRELRAVMETERAQWMRDTFNLLQMGPTFDIADDDLPVWFFQGDTVETILNSWQSVPPARGVR